jgi:hypothetical protein
MGISLQKVIDTTLRILLDEIDHALEVLSARQEHVVQDRFTYVGEDRIAIFVKHITERHLGALMLVDLDFRVIDVFDVLQLDAILNNDSGGTHGCVGSHLYGSETTSLVTLLAKL